jgi:glycosyltransferase involved in cell wall biosynthesis
MPVLASNVCDHPRLVADCARGYLFDPQDPVSIAAAIAKLVELADQDAGAWRSFAHNAREYASNELSVDKMVDSYEVLFANLLVGSTRH